LIFLDSSALVKRYVAEPGSDMVLEAMANDRDWSASVLAATETRIALCRRGPEGALDSSVQRRLADDFQRFIVVEVDAECLAEAEAIGCRFRVRTLDAIHLAAALRLPSVTFLSFDQRQCEVARSLGLVVVPT
jgi:predicted nucleic acid-binding protein